MLALREAVEQLQGALHRAERARAPSANRVNIIESTPTMRPSLWLAEHLLGRDVDVAQADLALHHAPHAHREQLLAGVNCWPLIGPHDERAQVDRRAPPVAVTCAITVITPHHVPLPIHTLSPESWKPPPGRGSALAS